MPAERKLVYRLDEGLAPSGEPKELHIVFRHGLLGSGFGPTCVFLVGCSQGIPTPEFVIDRAEWDWQINSHARHSCGASDSTASGRDQTKSSNRQINQGSYSPGFGGVSEVDHSGQRVGESIQQGEVQRGNDPVLHGSVGSQAHASTHKIVREYDYPTTGVLRDGWIDEAMATGHVTFDRRGRRVSSPVPDSQGRLQVSENSRSSQAHERSTAKRTGDGEGESIL